MRLIAHRLTIGDYGTIAEGQEFDAPDDVAESLIARYIAHRALPPRILYETKPSRFETPEVKPNGKAKEEGIRNESRQAENEGHRAEEVKPEAQEVAAEAARFPDGNVLVPDQEPPRMAPASNPVLQGADVPKQGTADSERRGKRKRFGRRG